MAAFRFRCEPQCSNDCMGRLAGEPRQIPGVAQGAAGVVLPAVNDASTAM